MADLEERMDKLEKRQDDLKNEVVKIHMSYGQDIAEIRSSLAIIKEKVTQSDNQGELKNRLIDKDVENNTKRIQKLEDNQSKLVWAIVLEVLGLVGSVIVTVISKLGV